MVILLILLVVVLLAVAVFAPSIDSFLSENRSTVETDVASYRARRGSEARRLKAEVAYETERAMQELRHELEGLS
ncbi:MAG TPA: hypothetical protein VGI76_02830 [Solirubrobacteraceae bacterium]|jgi:F0F1-type ATP synthase membrane subunit b/b'